MIATSVKTKRIVIQPVTRVEGHGKVTILLDEKAPFWYPVPKTNVELKKARKYRPRHSGGTMRM